MNKFLKLAVIPVAFLIAGTTTSCSISPREIALITDVGDIDDGSFNQESWEAVKEFAIDNHKTYDFYRPFNDSDFARSCAIKQAVAKGAEIIVLPGFKFAGTCATEHKKYPNVKFLLIDSSIGQSSDHDDAPNVCCVGFKCEYSGFSAGYTVATDLMKRDWAADNKLRTQYGYGYCGGMPSKGVYEFGFGLIQGICQATADFIKDHTSANKPLINIYYNYAKVFAQDDNATAKMKGWLVSDKGIKVLFPCGGKLYQSATEAVQHYNKHQQLFDYNAWLKNPNMKAPRDAARWIGVDSDQYNGLKFDYEKKTIYTSALKGLKTSIAKALELNYTDKWSYIGGGHPTDDTPVPTRGLYKEGQWILGLNSIFGEYPDEATVEYGDYVGIPTEYDEETHIMRGFDNFTSDECETLRNRLTGKATPTINVYGKSGEEYGAPFGIPENIVNWGDGSFRETYLGKYDADKIEVIVQ